MGARQPFTHRPTLDVQQFAIEPRDWLLSSHSVAPEVQGEWAAACAQAIARIQASGLASASILRLHGDCHPGNILWTPEVSAPATANDAGGQHAAAPGCPKQGSGPLGGQGVTRSERPPSGATAHDASGQHAAAPGRPKQGSGPLGGQGATRSEQPWGQQQPGPHFVDMDDARSGPAVQDLWMLLSGERHQRARALGALLDGYTQLREFDARELALIEPLRTLRLIHYSAWLARRWSDPTFPANFPWFGSRDYWTGQVQMLQEQIEAMDEPPLVY